ncbi:hypothetical protein [Sphingobacterium faecium]|uniref:hypothetical protein n=1 Tax=Sphingobacterium faecium TaxID=34087 RepID=UPI003209733B
MEVKSTKIIKACMLMSITAFLFSCQKDERLGTLDTAKVNVINAVVGGGETKVNVSTKIIPWMSISDNQILGGSNGVGRVYITSTDRLCYLQVAPVSDTTKFWYNQQRHLDAGKIYTLYLSGTAVNVKTSFHEETNFPKYILRDAGRSTPVADSIVNIRFINLSPTGPKVDVKIQGKSNNEASGLNYEDFTEFKAYPFTKNDNFIFFEIRRSSDNLLVANYALYLPNVHFKSIAIVMMGIYSGFMVPYVDQYQVNMVIY